MNFNPHDPTIIRLSKAASALVFLTKDYALDECVVQLIADFSKELTIADIYNELRKRRDLVRTELDDVVKDLTAADVLRTWLTPAGRYYAFTLEFLKCVRDQWKLSNLRFVGNPNVTYVITVGKKELSLKPAEFRKLYRLAKNYIELVTCGCIDVVTNAEQGIFYKEVWLDLYYLVIFVKKVEEEELISDKE